VGCQKPDTQPTLRLGPKQPPRPVFISRSDLDRRIRTDGQDAADKNQVTLTLTHSHLSPTSRSFRRQTPVRRDADASEWKTPTGAGASDIKRRDVLLLPSSRRGGRGCRRSVRRTESGALRRRLWLPPSFSFGGVKVMPTVTAGQLATSATVARRPATRASFSRLSTRLSARSSVGGNGGAGSLPSPELCVLRRAPKGKAATRRHQVIH
jgi:hypothetical protein